MKVFRNELPRPNVAIEGYILEQHEKLKNFAAYGRTGTSWQANLFIDVVKMSAGAWPTGETSGNGDQIFSMAAPIDVIDRAAQIVSLAIDEMESQGWIVNMPPVEDLLDDSAPVGFTKD